MQVCKDICKKFPQGKVNGNKNYDGTRGFCKTCHKYTIPISSKGSAKIYCQCCKTKVRMRPRGSKCKRSYTRA